MKKKIMFVATVGMMAVAACGCGQENSSGKVADDVNTESIRETAGTSESISEIETTEVMADGTDNAVADSEKSEDNTSTLEGEFVGWADSHTIEVKVEDGPMAFQVEDESVKEILEGFKEGTLFTFEIEWDDNGQRITKVLGE
ncbi:MAG: hypothetical protein ACI4F4_04775 [Lachnospiraceae bacterium]